MPILEPEETFLTVKEVAALLKLNQQTVRNWIDQGSLPALKVGRRVRIRRSDFEKVLEQSYSARTIPGPDVPTAQDFWDGMPVGVPDAETSDPSDTSDTTHEAP